MSSIRMIGESTKNLPWQDKPNGCEGVVWRHAENPIIGRNPTPKTARVFNSAVSPYRGDFVGIFRADHKDGKAQDQVNTWHQ